MKLLKVEIPHIHQLYHLSWAKNACVWRLQSIDTTTGRCFLKTPRTGKAIIADIDDLRHTRKMQQTIIKQKRNYKAHIKTNIMSTQTTAAPTKVITGKVRFSYLHVFEPKSVDGSSEAKYSVSLIIPKSDPETLNKIKAAIKSATEEGKAKFGNKIPANLKTPLRDGDEERPDDPAYADSYFVNANSKNKPGLVDKNRQQIIDKDEMYSGCYGRASLNFYAYNTNGNKGIAAGLSHLQKLADGEALGNITRAEDDFNDDYQGDDNLLD